MQILIFYNWNRVFFRLEERKIAEFAYSILLRSGLYLPYLHGIGVFDTLSDSIQYLNFAKKWFNSLFNSKISRKFNSKKYSIQKFARKFNSKKYSIKKFAIQKNIQFKNLQKNSIQNLIQNFEFGRIQFNNIFIQ